MTIDEDENLTLYKNAEAYKNRIGQISRLSDTGDGMNNVGEGRYCH